MTMNKKTRNKLIIISVSIFAAAVAAVGIWLAVQYQNDRKTTEVVPVNQISTTYWGDQSKDVYKRQAFTESSIAISTTALRSTSFPNMAISANASGLPVFSAIRYLGRTPLSITFTITISCVSGIRYA